MQKGGLLYSSEVINRILRILLENGSLKKTNLAGKAGLNHGVMMKYISFLKALKWIEMPMSSGTFEYISISIVGKQVLDLLETSDKKSTVAANHPSDIVNTSYYPLETTDAYARNNLLSKSQDSDSLSRLKKINMHGKRQKRKNILIVDDDEAILMTFESFLAPYGYTVKTFADAVSALRHFTKDPSYYSLAVLDIRLPNMNGLQLYQSLKALRPSLQVIFVTSLDAAQELITLIPGTSQSHIIRKPVNREHFVRVVASAIP